MIRKEWHLVVSPEEALSGDDCVFAHCDFYSGLFMNKGRLQDGLHVCFEEADGYIGFMSLDRLAKMARDIPPTQSIDRQGDKMTQLVQEAYQRGFIKPSRIIGVANSNEPLENTPLQPQTVPPLSLRSLVVNG